MVIKCPYCQHEGEPFVQKQMSSNGWVIFVLLLLFCTPLCWIPFVTEGTQEHLRKCTHCGGRIG